MHFDTPSPPGHASQMYRELRRLEELGHVPARARAELTRWLETATVGPPA